MTSSIQTNRDLYCAVTAALQHRGQSQPSLEVYLSRLRELVAEREGAIMSADDFAAILDAAFIGPAPGANIAELRELTSNEQIPTWQRQLAQQIVDLHEMADAGTLENEYRYFGVDAPSGKRWYNFDPHTFIECGLTGSFGGWTPGDTTGREYVPGKVAVVDEHGQLTSASPEEIEEPVVPMPTISWDDLADFLWAGQYYE